MKRVQKIVRNLKKWQEKNIIRKSIFDKFERFYFVKNKEIFNVSTHMTIDERMLLLKIINDYQQFLIKEERSFSIVEIGSYLGASSCFMAERLKMGKIYCIDTWQNDAMTEGNRDTYAEFRKNTEQYKDKIIEVRGWSYDVIDEIRKLTDNRIDLLFIDGDHSYEGVKKDWDLYSPLLHQNSIVVFHDTGWAEGVKKVIEEDVLKVAKEKSKLPNMSVFKITKEIR